MIRSVLPEISGDDDDDDDDMKCITGFLSTPRSMTLNDIKYQY